MKIALHYQTCKEFLCSLDKVSLQILFCNMSFCASGRKKNKTKTKPQTNQPNQPQKTEIQVLWAEQLQQAIQRAY